MPLPGSACWYTGVKVPALFFRMKMAPFPVGIRRWSATGNYPETGLWDSELLEGLLGSDLVVFQTHGHLQQFRSALLRVLGIERKVTEVGIGGRPVRLEALPIGIAPEEYMSLLNGDEKTAGHYRELVERYAGRGVLLAVDRLDYTKGVPERLRAYARLLRSSSELREKVILIQIAVPTREGIDTYQTASESLCSWRASG